MKKISTNSQPLQEPVVLSLDQLDQVLGGRAATTINTDIKIGGGTTTTTGAMPNPNLVVKILGSTI